MSLAASLPFTYPYAGVRKRRIAAFIVDYLLIGLLSLPAAALVGALGVLTLGYGFALYAVLGPAVALAYVAFTLGGAGQATFGMQLFGLRLVRLDGRPVDAMLAIMHTVLFWAANALLTPLVLVFTLLSPRKRALHDLMLGTEMLRADA